MKRHYVFIERKPITPSETVHPTLTLEECRICDDPTCELRELFGQTTIGLCEAEEEDLYALLVMSNDILEPKTMLVVDYFENKAKLYVGKTSDLEELKLKIEKAFRLIKGKEVIITEIEDLRGGGISKSRRKIELNYVFITYDNDEGGIKGSDVLFAPFCVGKIYWLFSLHGLWIGNMYILREKQKYKDMQTEINYTPDQAFKIIKNAYDETEALGVFKNNLVESVKPERGQIIIEAKEVFVFDREAVKNLLEEEFPNNRYRVSVQVKQISITKKL